MDIQQTINLQLYRRFEQAGIEFAFPTRTLHLSSMDLPGFEVLPIPPGIDKEHLPPETVELAARVRAYQLR